MTINVAAGGALTNKPFADLYAMNESMARNYYQWGREHAPI